MDYLSKKYHAVLEWFSIPKNRAKIYRPIIKLFKAIIGIVLIFIGGCFLSIGDTLRQSKLGNGFAVMFYAVGGAFVAWGTYRIVNNKNI